MAEPAQQRIVGVRLSKLTRIYYFDAGHIENLNTGDQVIVDTPHGLQLGQVKRVFAEPPKIENGPVKDLVRKATSQDIDERSHQEQEETRALGRARSIVAEKSIANVKVYAAEYSLDGRHLTFLFGRPENAALDPRRLRQELQHAFPDVQVELHELGPRDVARLVGGMGACGISQRCCSRFLTNFDSISIRMAKEQEMSLVPSDVTGMCGRLRCCLSYEYQMYVDARQGLPRKKKRVNTPLGAGIVIEVFPLKQSVLVDVPGEGPKEFGKDEIQELDAGGDSPAPAACVQGGDCPLNAKGDQHGSQKPVG
jgi:cell fate regulator YaaT (PSP1 superfamily)